MVHTERMAADDIPSPYPPGTKAQTIFVDASGAVVLSSDEFDIAEGAPRPPAGAVGGEMTIMYPDGQRVENLIFQFADPRVSGAPTP